MSLLRMMSDSNNKRSPILLTGIHSNHINNDKRVWVLEDNDACYVKEGPIEDVKHNSEQEL